MTGNEDTNMDERDVELERAALRLGREAERLDVERTVEGVLRRLRAVRPWWRRPVVLQVAAAVTLLIGATVVVKRGPWAGRVEANRAAVVVPFALDGLSSTELNEMLDSLVYEAPPSTYVAAGLQDLTESQLRELLRSMEG